jgi:hypothetical protein
VTKGSHFLCGEFVLVHIFIGPLFISGVTNGVQNSVCFASFDRCC